MASSSSTQNLQHNHPLLTPYFNTTAAPPPTPSAQTTTDTTTAADTLTRLLNRLPPNLSLPTRFSPRTATPTTTITPSSLPTLSLSTPSSFELGYFQLSPHHHSISPQLAKSAESEALALFDSSQDRKQTLLPKDWPLGFDDGDDGDHTASFCFDTTESLSESHTMTPSLSELTRELEKVGLHVVEKLACTMGFQNPFADGDVGPSSLMWISSLGDDDDDDQGVKMGRVYPYVVGLQYQIRAQMWCLVCDGGSVNVEPEVGSVLVTLGDIAQVWSNGKLKKVRGRPAAVAKAVGEKQPRYITMTMLLTLPLDSTVSPLLLHFTKLTDNKTEATKLSEKEFENNDQDEDDSEDEKVFNSFSFEDYAWRVYHERHHFKDPLDRYRLSSGLNN